MTERLSINIHNPFLFGNQHSDLFTSLSFLLLIFTFFKFLAASSLSWKHAGSSAGLVDFFSSWNARA